MCHTRVADLVLMGGPQVLFLGPAHQLGENRDGVIGERLRARHAGMELEDVGAGANFDCTRPDAERCGRCHLCGRDDRNQLPIGGREIAHPVARRAAIFLSDTTHLQQAPHSWKQEFRYVDGSRGLQLWRTEREGAAGVDGFRGLQPRRAE